MRRKNFGILLAVLISLIIFVAINIKNGLSEAQPAGGNILYVGGIGPNNYTHIQDAIDNASDGDTIFVYSGIYEEQIIVNKSLIIKGENNTATLIEGGFYVKANNTTIQNFSITYGYEWDPDG